MGPPPTDRAPRPASRRGPQRARPREAADAARPPSSAARAVSIVAPTLREAANIPVLARRVRDALSGRGIAWELLLVDDDSNDGSAAVVAELARRLPVRMVTRRGVAPDLSRSVLLGMRLARFDRVVVMDADLSHPPERIVDLLAALDAGCDMAVGSRCVPGSRLDPAWGPCRRLVSWAGRLLARPLADCRDPLSGFFATDRGLLQDTDDLRPLGYKIGLELMVRRRLGVREVAIGFGARGLGGSKMSWRTHLDFLRHLGRLYACRLGEAMRRPRRGDGAAPRGRRRDEDRRPRPPGRSGAPARTTCP